MFLNYDKVGWNFGCKWSYLVNKNRLVIINKKIDLVYKFWFVCILIVYYYW